MGGASWLLLTAGAIALVAVVAGARLGVPRAGAWAALAALVQAMQLSLVKAGPLIGYQHLDVGVAWRDHRITLTLLAVFVLVTVVGVARRAAAFSAWLRSRTSRWTFACGHRRCVRARGRPVGCAADVRAGARRRSDNPARCDGVRRHRGVGTA